MLDEPAVVLVAATGAAIFLLLEVALPTVGLAGTAGIALAVLAGWGADQQGDAWWPLLGVVAAITVWGVFIARHRHPLSMQAVAAALFAGGSLGYAVSTEDWSAALAAAVGTVLLVGFAFPRIAAGADRLLGAPPHVGMESMIGTPATVTQWEGAAGKVLIAGTLWSATGPEGLTAGDAVVVEGTAGLVLRVDGVASRHG